MAGPENRDTYNPVPSAEPVTQAPNDTLSLRADPSSFGTQIGQAKEQLGESQMGLGKAIAGFGGDITNIATSQQGIINETLATNAETQATSAYGTISGKYKSLEGLQAVQQLPKATQDIINVRQQIRSTLPNPAAQRAFDQLAARREGFALADVNGYSATQLKVADTRSATDALQSSVDQAGAPGISDAQFGSELGNIRFQAGRVMTNQGYGADAGTGMQQASDGTLTFDTTTENGQKAKAATDQYVNKQIGQAWENRIRSVSDTNVADAYNKLQANKGNMPPETYNKLSNLLAAPVKNEFARSVAMDTLGNYDQKYSAQFSGNSANNDSTAANLGDDSDLSGSKRLTSAFLDQESGNGKTSPNIGQIQPATFAAYAKPGEDVTNPADNRTVTARIVDHYNTEYNGDAQRVAVAYFSGEGNVAPAGSPTPWKQDYTDKNGQSVSNYVSDINGRLGLNSGNIGTAGANGRTYESKADYYGRNWDTISNETRQNAINHNFDTTVADQAVDRVQQYMRQTITAQEQSTRAAGNNVIQAINGDDKHPPLVLQDQLDHSTGQLHVDWLDLQANNPILANNIKTRLIPANAKGQTNTYGTDIYHGLMDTLSGNVKDTLELYGKIDPDAGDKSPLTTIGVKALDDVQKQNETPEGQAFSHSEAQFFKQAHDSMTGGGLGLSPGVTNEKGEERFRAFVAQALPQIQNARNEGKTSADLFNDPKSPDFIGRMMKAPDPTALMKETIEANIQAIRNADAFKGAQKTGAAGLNYQSLSDLAKDVGTKVKRQDAVNYALQKGWIQPTPPPVPKPDF